MNTDNATPHAMLYVMLHAMPYAILYAMVDARVANKEQFSKANILDLKVVNEGHSALQLVRRLKLTRYTADCK